MLRDRAATETSGNQLISIRLLCRLILALEIAALVAAVIFLALWRIYPEDPRLKQTHSLYMVIGTAIVELLRRKLPIPALLGSKNQAIPSIMVFTRAT